MKTAAILIVLAVILILLIFFLNRNREMTDSNIQIPTQTITTTPLSTPVKFSASFKIITSGIVRNFSASKYHNQSEDVYIESNDPNRVIIESKGVTWGDFFNSLPMKLTKECLTTGDGEILCSSETSSLNFYLNEVEDENLLDKEISPGDSILIEYKSN